VIPKFLEGAGRGIADGYIRATLGVAGAYWLVVALLLGVRYGFDLVGAAILNLQPTTQIALVVTGFAVLMITAAVVDALVFPVTRLLEGYGPIWRGRLWVSTINRQLRRRQTLLARWNRFASLEKRTSAESMELVALDVKLRRFPDDPKDTMPTELGNILRASERRPLERYGLDAVAVWTHLWLVLSDDVRREVLASRLVLDTAVRAFIWALLLAPWAFLFWQPAAWHPPMAWVPPERTQLLFAAVIAAAVGGSWLAYLRACSAAVPYGLTIEATFDVGRNALYHALRMPLASTAKEEKPIGKAVSRFLYRSFTNGLPPYVDIVEDTPADATSVVARRLCGLLDAINPAPPEKKG